MLDHGDGHGSTNPNEEDPLKYLMLNSQPFTRRTDFYCGMEKIVTFKNLTYEALTAKAPGWRMFFKVKHSMELGFLKTTRSCCHYENFTYIFQLNHQQMSMKVCRQLEHCEQLNWCEKLGREDR
ncbi:hypothetical protein T01_14892, partial [Trichinella spiralis]